MTKSIQKLEAALAVPLFERGSKGAEPTKFAHILYRHARVIEDELRYAMTELSNVTEGLAGKISIGIGPALGLSVFPSYLAELQKRYPRTSFDVTTGVRDRLLPLVARGEIDIWVGSLHEIESVPSLESVPFGEAEMTLFCRPDHPLRDRSSLGLADLSEVRWAFFREDDHGPKMLMDILARNGVEQCEEGLRCDSLAQLFAAAGLSDLVVYAANTLAGEAKARGLVQLHLGQELWSFPVGLAFRSSVRSLTVVQ